MKLELLERLLVAGGNGLAAALATHLDSGAQRLVMAQDDEGDLPLSAEELAAVRQALHDDRSTMIEMSAGPVFIEVWNPKLRLIVIGAVHTAQALVPLARLAGYDVTVIDPRTAFGTAVRFPDTTLCHDWPDKALTALEPDRRTAIVTLTHDPKLDDPALRVALNSDAFYVGALGSRRTHAKRTDRLAAAGFDSTAIARIRGPIGLAIGALTPAEIAISIIAEITAVLRRAPLSNRTTAP